MTSKSAIADFVAQHKLAVVGVSRSGKTFGNLAFKELKARRYRLFLVHPSAEMIDGETVLPELERAAGSGGRRPDCCSTE